MKEVVVELDEVEFVYNYGLEDETRAIDRLSLKLFKGEFVALTGHNGSGKSTLARLLNGLIVPTSGSVCVFGKDTADKKQLFDIRSRVGVVFQNPDNQMVATIIEDDVAFGPENLGISRPQIRKRVDDALKSVGMYEYKDGTPFRLSGGQKQRLAIAGVLALCPDVMVLDEATSMLDPTSREEVLSLVKELIKNKNITVIMITHFMEEAALADRIIVLKNGKISLDGTPREVFCHAKEIEEAGLELPLCAQIALDLNKNGVDIGADTLSLEELVDRLIDKRGEICR